MERRSFLKNSLLASSLMLGHNLFAETKMMTKAEIIEKSQGFKKSIMWETIGIKGSILEKCQAVKKAGFMAIQPSSHMNREEVLSAMKATGLQASSVCNSKHWKVLMSSPDENIRKDAISNMITAMEDAKAYGTDAVLLVPGVVNESSSYDQCCKYSTLCIKELEPIAKKMQVYIAVENVWNNFLLSPMEAVTYIDQFQSGMVKFYFDVGNIMQYGWPEQWIKILGSRITRLHIKEFSRKLADEKGRWAGFKAPLTEGDINWPKVVEALREINYDSWLTTEQSSGETYEGLLDLRERLDKIISA